LFISTVGTAGLPALDCRFSAGKQPVSPGAAQRVTVGSNHRPIEVGLHRCASTSWATCACTTTRDGSFTSGTYTLTLRPAESDLAGFAGLAAEGHGSRSGTDLGRPVRVLRAAATLWQGPPITAAMRERSTTTDAIGLRFEELRLRVYTDLVDAVCRSGLEPSRPTRDLYQAMLRGAPVAAM
jgi:hypothetical protein